MSETTEQTTQQTGAASTPAAGELRDVPNDIGEYKKFVAEGGHEHNEKILGREAAVAAAKAAGIVPESEPGETQERRQKNSFQQRVGRLQRKIGERDATIADLRAQIASNGTHGTSTAPPNGAAPAPARAPAKADEKTAAPNGAQKTPARPVESDFKTYAEFVEALTDWKTDRKLEERERRADEAKRAGETEARGKTITDAHNARVDEAKTRYPDWDKAFKGMTDESFSDPMVVFIFESEHGPDVTYYLATHREELDRIRALSPLRQAAALGKIEEQFATETAEEEETTDEEKPAAKPAAAEPEPKPKTKRVSSAPPPAKPLGGKGGADDAMPDPKDFKAYESWARRQAAKGVKR